jgi:hypothetical protein
MVQSTAMNPTVLMIGEAKCGTSAVFEHLVSHGRFCPTPFKELHYFDRTCSFAWNHEPNFVPQAKEYHQRLTAQCAGRCNHLYTIDATPAYLRTPGVERLVRQMVYDPRIVVLLRNPATRLYSNYWMHRRRGRLAGQSFNTFATEYIPAGSAQNCSHHVRLRDESRAVVSHVRRPTQIFHRLSRIIGPVSRHIYGVAGGFPGNPDLPDPSSGHHSRSATRRPTDAALSANTSIYCKAA